MPAALYVWTLDPVVGDWDVAEMQTVPYIMGIAHTTGYPTFILLGWLFSHVFAIGAVAWRINLLCALYLAAACWAISAIQVRIGVRPAIALLVTLLFASGPIVWWHALRADVLSLAVLFATLIILMLLVWSQTGRKKYFFLACLLAGLSLGDHLLIAWLLPGAVAMLLWSRKLLSCRKVATGALLFLAGVSVYAYLPIRSAIVSAHRYDQTLTLGLPPGRPYWDYAHPANFQNFVWLVSGSQVNAPHSLSAMLNPRDAAEAVAHFSVMAVAEFSVVGVVALIIGVWFGLRNQAPLTTCIIVTTVLVALFTAAFGAETDPDRYYMVPFALMTVLVGLGFSAPIDRIASRRPGLAYVSITVALFALLVVGGYRSQAIFGWRYDRWGPDYIARVRSYTPPNAIIIAPWVYATPLAYAEYVERSLGNRVVETATLDNDKLYLQRWSALRPIYVVFRQPIPSRFRLVEVSSADPPLFRLKPK